MWVQSFGLTDKGRLREINEDSFAVVTPADADLLSRLGSLLVVADGMGGGSAGEVASAMAAKILPEAYFSDWDEPEGALARAVRAAGVAIQRDSRVRQDRSGMGTTVVAAALAGGKLVAANVGDSRAYLIRGEAVRQITRDHSLVAELVAMGALTADEARTDPRRNIITRVLGGENSKPELFSVRLSPGDIVLLCSDGLHSLVSSEEMGSTIHGSHALEEAAQALVQLANDRGGFDNVTVVLARLAEEE